MEVMKMKPHEWASYPGDLVMASTFDAVLQRAEAAEAALEKLRRDNDDSVAEYKKDSVQDHAVILAFQRRAEAAEAKVAELELRLANVSKVAAHACDVRDDSIADLELRLATSTDSMYANMKTANEAEAQLAELRSTSSVYERDMHAALDRIADATARIAKVFGEQIGHGLPIDGPFGCVQWCLDKYAELRAERERMRNDSPYVRCLEGDGVPYVLRVGISTRNWDGSQSTHPHWHIQRLTWSEYGGPFSSPEKANEYLAGLLERNPNYYVTIDGIAALAAAETGVGK